MDLPEIYRGLFGLTDQSLIQRLTERGELRSVKKGHLLYREGEAVCSVFANDAPGLAQEDVQHVFDRFFTADKMRTGQSTGLGLAIVKALVERMGHTVTAELTPEGLFQITVRWRIAGRQG